MPLDNTIIKNIKTLMFMNNYKLKDFSKITGILEGCISRQLKGKRSFTTKHLELYSKAFKIKPHQLLDENLITIKIKENINAIRT
jgi:antitoxin component HigA of HigAB toxin-antitoxin module